MQTIQLANGLRVANFSSPHPFTFTTGEVLPACDPERARALQLDTSETETPDLRGFTNVRVAFAPSWEFVKAINAACDAAAAGGIDVIIVPLVVLQTLRADGWSEERLQQSPFRTVRMADRVTKHAHPDRFCL